MRTAGTAVAGGQRNRFKGKRGGSLTPSITMILMNLFYILSPFMCRNICTFTHLLWPIRQASARVCLSHLIFQFAN